MNLKERIKNRIAENSQLMVTAKFPHLYYRAVGTRKLDQILDEVFGKEDVQKESGKKPVLVEHTLDGGTATGWCCPTCDTRYESEAGDCLYCPYCGQKIDWSNYDSE